MHLKITKLFILLPTILLLWSCQRPTPMSDDYIMQLDSVGLREGVFVRRYQLTADSKSKQHFSASDLQTYIEEKLLPDYLLLQHAHELGMQHEAGFQQKMTDFKISLLAGQHPSKFEKLTILKSDVQKFYQKKSVKYDLLLVQANSFVLADSLYQRMLSGAAFAPARNEAELVGYPRVIQLTDLFYGEKIHPELLPLLDQLKPGEVSQPVYTSPTWSLVKLNRKLTNLPLPAFETVEQNLVMQLEAIQKYQREKELIANLRQKYQIQVAEQHFPALKAAFSRFENAGVILKQKVGMALLAEVMIQVGGEKITVNHFITNFNQANQFVQLTELTDRDLQHFLDDFTIQLLLSLDAAEKGVLGDPYIQDQLENKAHRLLLPEYLKQEIAQKVVLSDADVRAYYEANRTNWPGEYEKIALNVKNDLKNKKMQQMREAQIQRLRQQYAVRYHDIKLKNIADAFNASIPKK